MKQFFQKLREKWGKKDRKLIIGLGNPGKEYENTRHNLGFRVVDHLQNIWKFPDFKHEKKFFADISENTYEGQNILLVKPQTFMNISGKTVAALINYYKIPYANILIIFDDLDMDLGKLRIKNDSGSGGHNGIKSIIQSIGSKEFNRLKLGIGNKNRDRIPADKFVLQKFRKEEENIVIDMIIQAGDMVEEMMK